MRKEILKNKPAKIEEFIIALCKARQDGQPNPSTHPESKGTAAPLTLAEKGNLVKLKKHNHVDFNGLEVHGRGSQASSIGTCPSAETFSIELSAPPMTQARGFNLAIDDSFHENFDR